MATDTNQTIARVSVQVEIDRNRSGHRPLPQTSATCWLGAPAVEPLVVVHVFVDATIVEVFVNGGRVSMTTRVYPENTVGQLGLRSRGCTLQLATVEAHGLGSIWLE